MEQTFGPISAIGALFLGIALLWTIRLAYGSQRHSEDDALRLILTIGGWTLIHVGVISVFCQLFPFVDGPLGIASWLTMLGLLGTTLFLTVFMIFAMAVGQFRKLEWTSLMWTLAAAAKQGIPLTEAADAFAAERTDEIGLRTRRLSDLLSAGVPLPDALQRSQTSLPIEGTLAARFGCETGDLSLSISYLVNADDEIRFLLRTTLEKCLYLGIVVMVVVCILTFMMIKILPIFSRMFDEFGVDLPSLTRWVLLGGEYLTAPGQFFSIGILIALVFIGSLCAMVVGVVHYIGWLPADVPIINKLALRFDGAMIMRCLATTVKRRRPLDKEIWTLSRIYPKRSVRRRLERAGSQMNNGEKWADSLHRAGIIRGAESAVLSAAERADNLEWALTEMAESSIRRVCYRMRLWINLFFPLVMLVLGALIVAIVVGLFLPLVSLIEGVL